jgi:hypothetical protein
MNRHLLKRAPGCFLTPADMHTRPYRRPGEKFDHIIAFRAHPDDCDETAKGTAAKWVAAGCRCDSSL